MVLWSVVDTGTKSESKWLHLSHIFYGLNGCSRIVNKTELLFLVLTAAVTQASLQSILHKILTAGPSAFNITSLISQAAQLSTQGIQSHLFTYLKLLHYIL